LQRNKTPEKIIATKKEVGEKMALVVKADEHTHTPREVTDRGVCNQEKP
jgi:hypothetical protein